MAAAGVKHSYFLVVLMTFIACNSDKPVNNTTVNTPEPVKLLAPDFNADSAFAFVKTQVDFGPRVPGSAGHAACALWLESKLKEYCDTVIVQRFQAKAYDGKLLNGKNIIASFKPGSGNRILLSAHWDTRHVADQDTEKRDVPIDGANDGGSGVGVLIEIARQLKLNNTNAPLDIILFDIEDYGQPDDSNFPAMEHSYCLGSQYWARNMHVFNYYARFGINLDMVGAENARFTQEGTSMQFAGDIMNRVWKIASECGYGEYFPTERTKPIIDDHYYVNALARIRSIDIIHYDASTSSNFWKHWHTHDDTIDKISKNSLKAAGQTVLEVIYREQSL